MTDAVSSKTVTSSAIRAAVEWLAQHANGVSLIEWEPRSQTLLHAADEIDRLRAALGRLDVFGQRNYVGSVTFETIRKIVREGKGSQSETSSNRDAQLCTALGQWLHDFGSTNELSQRTRILLGAAEETTSALPHCWGMPETCDILACRTANKCQRAAEKASGSFPPRSGNDVDDVSDVTAEKTTPFRQCHHGYFDDCPKCLAENGKEGQS